METTNVVQELRKSILSHIYKIRDKEEFIIYLDSLLPDISQLLQTCIRLSLDIISNAVHYPPVLGVLLERGLYFTPPSLPGQCICTCALEAAVHQELLESVEILLSDDSMRSQIETLDINAKSHIICRAGPLSLARILADSLFPITSYLIYYHGLKINKNCLRIIFNHPSGRHVLREFTDGNLLRYAELYYETYKERYKNLQETINEIKKEQCRINMTMLFCGIILSIRMNDFVKRYWGPGGKGYLRVKKRFEMLQSMRAN